MDKPIVYMRRELRVTTHATDADARLLAQCAYSPFAMGAMVRTADAADDDPHPVSWPPRAGASIATSHLPDCTLVMESIVIAESLPAITANELPDECREMLGCDNRE